MGTRLELHEELLNIAPNVYYNTPTAKKMSYPCICYKRTKIQTKYADNKIYRKFSCYTVTYIAPAVSDDKVDEILDHFSYCQYDRPYVADGLHHYVFTLFY